MRTCAHVSISDCKTANNVQYCYCDTQACNSPDRHLAPVVSSSRSSHEQQRERAGKRHEGGGRGQEGEGKGVLGGANAKRGSSNSGVERKALGFTSAAHSPPAFASQYPGGHFSDDEVSFHP